MTDASYFILDQLFLEKAPLNLGSYFKYLVISISFKGWSGTKSFYLYNPFYSIFFLLFWPPFPKNFIIKCNANNNVNIPSCPFPALLNLFPDITFINEEATGYINEEPIAAIIEAAICAIIAPRSLCSCLFVLCFTML